MAQDLNVLLHNIFTVAASEELLRVYEENEVSEEERHILLDVSVSEDGSVFYQIASVNVEDDGVEDELHTTYKHPRTGATVYVETSKIKYFKDLEVHFGLVVASSGDAAETFIFRARKKLDT